MLEEMDAKEALMLDVIVAYVQVLTARDIVGQSEKRLILTAAQVDRMSHLQLLGAIQPSEYYDLKGQYASDHIALNETKKVYLQAKFALAKLLNLGNVEASELVALNAFAGLEDFEFLSDETAEIGLAQMPGIQAARLRIREAEYKIKYAKSAYFPRLTTSMGFESRYSSNAEFSFWNQTKHNVGKYISFGMTIPILSGFNVKNNVNRARLTLLQASDFLEYNQSMLTQNISQNADQLVLAQANYAYMVEEESSFTESFRIAKTRFEAGDLQAVFFLTAKNNMEQAQAKRLIGQYEWKLQTFLQAYYKGALPWQTWGDLRK
jgi:outer membrane protein